ncbi:MAG: ASPIC/UnbV domain-containing protein [Verrucomicrobiales bacterium]
MSQPHDRLSQLDAIGEIDEEAGEFWVKNPFEMPNARENLSAFERNRTFLNLDGNSFIDVSFASGADIDSDSRSVVAADFNLDGATDLLVGSVGGGSLRLFLNRFPKANYARIRLEGSESNRAGIGARLTATVGARKLVRDLFPQNGFMGQGPAEIIFGLGDATAIDHLEVRWPSGKRQVYDNLAANQYFLLKEEPK